jgi:hypothetical protein
MNLTESIESAESMFRQILEDFFISVYDEKNLYSHGIDHHHRVWSYARELLYIPLSHYNSRPACPPDKLIIACFMHDSGMSVDPGLRHGKQGREFCRQFLYQNNLHESDFKDVLDTVENHDRKDYPSDSDRNDLLTVLSVADDLDAFGFTGIYRYAEIYLTRGIAPDELGNLILGNAAGRFENIERIFGAGNDFVQLHRKRYAILSNFFLHYNRHVKSYNFDTAEPEGYCGVIQLFKLMLKYKMTLDYFFTEAEIYPDDIIIGSFLAGLKSELLLNNRDEQ